jgi:hypothetical protein
MSQYPLSIPSLINPSSGQFLNSPSHSDIETAQNNEIIAIATELGIGLKGLLSNLASRLNVSLNADGTLVENYLTASIGFLIDQISPQTIINGSPIFDEGIKSNGDIYLKAGQKIYLDM